ncbi:MAG: hypothetical protein O7H41_18790 [Planctomycetota bacterium]|nr:hypothetical protein [Planctomycetota bacterium]
MPPPVGIKEKTRSVKRYLRILEKKHRIGSAPGQATVLDQLILHLLSFEAPMTNAAKAVRMMREEFVDWNDVRVSSIREIATILEECRISIELAYQLKEILGQLFIHGHTISLEFLLEMEADTARKFVNRLRGLPGWAGTYLLALTGKGTVVPLDPHTFRVGQRLGLFGRKSTVQTRTQTLKSIVSSDDTLRFHSLLVEHGKKTCRVENPRCDVCSLARDCEYRRKLKKARSN